MIDERFKMISAVYPGDSLILCTIELLSNINLPVTDDYGLPKIFKINEDDQHPSIKYAHLPNLSAM